jgi:lipopolysaccharide biosynthesis glycosyltransferase
MNIVFCADRRVLPGLHVALYSVLERYEANSRPDFTIFSDDLDEADQRVLAKSLDPLKKPYGLEIRRVDAGLFAGFPQLNGSWATYYRLLIPSMLDANRFLYLDADILCDLDVSQLEHLDMGEAPAGFVSEAPLSGCADRDVAKLFGASPDEPYFNAGIMLVNATEWRRQQISEQALDFLRNYPADYWDQSALNFVLYRKAYQLDERFNTIVNMRKHWPALKMPVGSLNRLLHFVDYPKPWDLGAEFIHPQYRQWRRILDKTAIRNFRSWNNTPARKWPKTAKARIGYKKTARDRILFFLYYHKIIKNIKGVIS